VKTQVEKGKITIECPACIGSERVKFYKDKKKYIKFVCGYCKNVRRINLTDFLLDKKSIARVSEYEKKQLGGN
jgi:endogenous inhibitor of DNA gyrase (YacG/DUF329 family)